MTQLYFNKEVPQCNHLVELCIVHLQDGNAAHLHEQSTKKPIEKHRKFEGRGFDHLGYPNTILGYSDL
jgi:hypothetical protein